MKNNWREISIKEYKRIVDLQKRELDDESTIIELIAILNETTPEEVWNYSMSYMNETTNQLGFINDFPKLKKVKYDKLKIGEWDLRCDINMKDFTVAQYTDFQHYWSLPTKDLARVISVFYKPKGRKYSDGYDIEELVSDIEENIDIVTANEIAFFLFRKLWKSTLPSQIFLKLMAQRVAKKMKKIMK